MQCSHGVRRLGGGGGGLVMRQNSGLGQGPREGRGWVGWLVGPREGTAGRAKGEGGEGPDQRG